jgi:preprotein translocase subunit SecA
MVWHQAVEAKEGAKVEDFNANLCYVVAELLQNVPQVSGMTGTAETEAG